MPGDQNSNSNQITVNVDKPTNKVTIHKSTCPHVKRMRRTNTKNGGKIDLPTVEEAIKYARDNYENFELKMCKTCSPEQK